MNSNRLLNVPTIDYIFCTLGVYSVYKRNRIITKMDFIYLVFFFCCSYVISYYYDKFLMCVCMFIIFFFSCNSVCSAKKLLS